LPKWWTYSIGETDLVFLLVKYLQDAG